MRLEGKRIGFALTGSHCTLAKVLPAIEKVRDEGAQIFPILSTSVDETDTRFGKAEFWKEKLIEITGNKPITTIKEAEPIGPQGLLDVVVIAPCTGNTLGKLANGIIDSPVLMAAKAHLRNLRPLVIGISTNDGLGLNAKNIGLLLNSKNIYMIPFGQDDPFKKENSLVARFELTLDTIILALEGRQIQPVLIQY